MAPHELIAELVRQTGKSTLQIAREMSKASFQGTLHRYINGNAPNPTHNTAKTIADYFSLPVAALYDKTLAARIAKERGLSNPASPASVFVAREPAPANNFEPPSQTLPPSLLQRIASLTPAHHKGLVAVIEAYLAAIEPATAAPSKARRA